MSKIYNVGFDQSLMKFRLTPSVFGCAESTSPEVEATSFAETYQGFPLRGSCHEVTDEVAKV